MARVLIADDHPLMRDALRPVLQDLFGDGVEIADADSLEMTLAALDQGPFDLVLLDLCMPGGGDAAALLAARDRAGQAPVVVISHWEEAAVIRQCIAAGAAGFIPKSLDTALIRSALRLVADGGQYFPAWALAEEGAATPASGPADTSALTRRQRTVLRLLGEGQSNRQIADALHLSEWTVKAHVSAVLRKLGVSTRVQAALIGRQLG